MLSLLLSSLLYAGGIFHRGLFGESSQENGRVTHRDIFSPLGKSKTTLDSVKDMFYSWGLDRINQQIGGLDELYYQNENGNKDVVAYVLDTGVDYRHPFLNIQESRNEVTYEDTTSMDEGGHGSHVAGIIAGTFYGVSPNTPVISVKVLGEYGGTNEDIVRGMRWVADKAKKEPKKKHVVNMSLGGNKRPSDRMMKTIDELYKTHDNLLFVVAAGNSHSDACYHTPAGSKAAITVGATNIDDEVASFSNYGPCVDIFAPGRDIISSWLKGTTIKISGTSMATPFVTGALCDMWSKNMHMNHMEIKQMLFSYGTWGVVKGLEDHQHQGETKKGMLYDLMNQTYMAETRPTKNLFLYHPTDATCDCSQDTSEHENSYCRKYCEPDRVALFPIEEMCPLMD